MKTNSGKTSGIAPVFILLIAVLSISGCSKESKPNIILILADDMGYSDIGCMGSEIKTPNIDGLANEGVLFLNFYNGARCCPTRASLMTGLYAHQTGMGGMEPDRGLPGYRGNINNNCVTLAEALKHNGYSTYMSGKWHLTNITKTDKEEEKYNWPVQRGFDRFYGTIAGAGNFFMPATLTRQNTNIEQEAKDNPGYYYTDAISENAVKFISEHKTNNKKDPFFMYVAYTAPHWPLHAPEEDIEKYRGVYSLGWDSIRQSRYDRMKEMGIIDPGWGMAPRDERVPAWDEINPDDLPEQVHLSVDNADELRRLMAEKMAVYAAMIDRMDRGIGEIVAALEDQKCLDNTLIVFLSDNGGCDEWGTYGFGWNNYRNTGIIAGNKESNSSYGPAWAHVSNTPFRLYKLYTYEGGTSTPMIMHWPEKIKSRGSINRQVSHIIDIMPTFLNAANGTYPTEYKGNEIIPPEGHSLLPVLAGDSLDQRTLYWEHIGGRAVRKGKWKLTGMRGAGPWELFDIEKDRTEQNDLSDQYPQVFGELKKDWEEWAERTNALPWPYKDYETISSEKE
ncbi:MAG: arylsulfatase [Bacteroidales bacterium]|nr:arylsulfatase [Bacteroidales bacterium]